MKTVVSLFNMYKGGSRSIFDAIEKSLISSPAIYLLVFGNKFSVARNKTIIRYPVRYLNWLYRLLIENILAAGYGYVLNADRLVMMGNFPSLLWFRSQVVFFHNTLYLESNNESDSLKIRLEKKLFKAAIKLKKPIICVQTSHVESLLKGYFKENFHVKVVGSPIAEARHRSNKYLKIFENDTVTLIYPAYYYPHKNHRLLLKNHKLFEELNCEVILTIDIADVISEYSDLKRVKFVGSREKKDLLELYAKSDALIFPSLNESLGLPLLEAEIFGLPIIAPNLSYVHAVVSNYYVYDADSDISFGNAVRECVHGIRNSYVKKAKSLVTTDVVDFIDCLVK